MASEFQPDDAGTPRDRNDRLSDLVGLGGVWHRKDIESLRRLNTDPDGNNGWLCETADAAAADADG